MADIIVTAQRRSENVQKTALSIDVLSVDALGQASANRVSDLANMVPAAQFTESGNGQQSIYIRGVGAIVVNSYTDPAVAFNVDGVYVGRPSSMTGVMYDLARVEVLKGPQGTLYGRNATGGAVNILPNRPRLGERSANLSLTVGNYEQIRTEAAVNLPLGESAAARLALVQSRHDPYQTDGSGDERSYAGRLQFLFEPTDALSIRISGDMARDRGHGAAGTIVGVRDASGVYQPSGLDRDVGPLDPRSTAIFEGQYSFQMGRTLGAVAAAPFVRNNFWGVTGEVNLEAGFGTVTFIPAYRESNLNYNDVSIGFTNYGRQKDNQTSLELRAASENTGLIRWLAGLYYFDENIRSRYQFNQASATPFQRLDTGTTSEAAFGQLTVAPVDALRFVAGGRLSHEKKRFDGASQVLLSICNNPVMPMPACPDTPLLPFAPDFATAASQLSLIQVATLPIGAAFISPLPGAENTTFLRVDKSINDTTEVTKFNWRLGVEYDAGPNSLLYANVTTGYHGGGFAFSLLKPSFGPETLTAYSIGSKNRFLNGKLQANIELFYWKYKDQQLTHGGTDSDGTFTFYTENVGSATNKGAEVSIQYRVLPRTTLSFDAQYLDASYDHFSYDTPASAGPPETSCPYTLSSPAFYTIDCSGRRTLRSPKWSLNAGIEQAVDIGEFTLTGNFNTHYQTSSMIGFEMLATQLQDSYFLSNASLRLSPRSEQWSLTAFVNNIENNRPLGSVFVNSAAGVIAGAIGAPRTYGLQASARF